MVWDDISYQVDMLVAFIRRGGTEREWMRSKGFCREDKAIIRQEARKVLNQEWEKRQEESEQKALGLGD